jgi:hypothetical protein
MFYPHMMYHGVQLNEEIYTRAEALRKHFGYRSIAALVSFLIETEYKAIQENKVEPEYKAIQENKVEQNVTGVVS